MITPQDLEAAGYRGSWNDSYRMCRRHADRLFQKRIIKEGKTLYFINFWMYDNGRFPQALRPMSFEMEIHLYPSEGRCFNISTNVEPEDTVADLEALTRRTYDALGCVPDPHNQ